MFNLIWHIILLTWTTGVLAVGYTKWERRDRRESALRRELADQAQRTRLAELQARERTALGAALDRPSIEERGSS